MLNCHSLLGVLLLAFVLTGCNNGHHKGAADYATSPTSSTSTSSGSTSTSSTSTSTSTSSGSTSTSGTSTSSGSTSTSSSGTTSTSTSSTGIASTDPAFYTTPTVVGATNLISVSPGADLESYFKTLKPGDILELSAGTYSAPSYPGIENSGTASSWIVVRGKAGSKPVIDLMGSGELHIGASYLSFENLEVIHGLGNNIHVVPISSTVAQTNVLLKNVKSDSMSSGTGAALKMAGNWKDGVGAPLEYVYVEDSEFSGSLGNAVIDCVAVRSSVVRGCYIHDPIDTTYTCPGIFFKGGSSNILIEKNLIRGIHKNAAVMVGGDTGASYFDGLYYSPKVEGVSQTIRNNILADFSDSAFDVRGCHGASIYNNTIVTQTSFVIFRLSWGGSGSGTMVGNYSIDMTNNLVLAYGTPEYAENDGNADATLTFGHQLWGGGFKAPYGPALPSFPQAGDVTTGSGTFGAVVVDPSYTSLTGLADAKSRYALVATSLAKGKGNANTIAPYDILDVLRSTTAPSLGAFE